MDPCETSRAWPASFHKSHTSYDDSLHLSIALAQTLSVSAPFTTGVEMYSDGVRVPGGLGNAVGRVWCLRRVYKDPMKKNMVLQMSIAEGFNSVTVFHHAVEAELDDVSEFVVDYGNCVNGDALKMTVLEVWKKIPNVEAAVDRKIKENPTDDFLSVFQIVVQDFSMSEKMIFLCLGGSLGSRFHPALS